jgi:gamma-glutamyltranspeptidase / glutathione hydrolase
MPGSWLATRLLALGLIFGLAPLSCDRQRPEPAHSRALPVEPAPTSVEPAPVETGPDDGSARRLPARAGQGTEVGIHGAVTSAEAHASEIGLEVLQKGGNAVDAAVAVGFALGVTHPSAGNIGGGGFMIIRLPDGTATTIDYREVAPLKAHRDMYLDKKGEVTRKSREGALAAGIPGVVAGLAMAHAKFGSLPWKDLVMPSVKLAREGWKLDSFHAEDLSWGSERMKALAEVASKDNPKGALAKGYAATLATFLKSDGSAYETGELWRQPDLADTLEAIANQGADAFYQGPLARKMAERVQAMGGIWTEKDLAEYRAIEREPLTFDYRGHGIITMPPPSAGGVVLRHVLAASEVLALYDLPWMSIERIHLYVEALRRIYADRNFLIGDPAFVDIPMKTLLDVSYMSQRMADVDRNKATPSSKVGTGIQYKESSQTTHFSVVDRSRMAVSNTYTLNGGFGAKLLIPGTGVILNNEMDDFTVKVGAPNMFGLVQGPQNSIAPRKRMLSSMTPTIVTKDGKLRAVVGSPGGPTISTTVAQIIMQLIDHKLTLSEAVASPRIHHQWLPDRIWHEPLDKGIIAAFEKLGHAHVERGSIGHANCIEIDPETGGVRAVADVIRDGGKAVAY